MVGGDATCEVERALQWALQAAAMDLAETLLETGRVARVILATSDSSWVQEWGALPVEVDADPPGESFHFGRRLAQLIQRTGTDSVLYAGGGSAPLMSPEAWREVLDHLSGDRPQAITNNLYSSDWIAFYPAPDLVPSISAVERDNALGWIFSEEVGIPTRSLAPSAATRFDLDTPTDLLIASLHPRIRTRLHSVLGRLDWVAEMKGRVEQILAVMARPGGHLAIVGRSAPSAWLMLDQATRCWVRLFVEERGMVASGRLRRGEVRSLLADFLDYVGIEGFFAELAALAEAALLDNRVLLAAWGLWPSPADRFNSDLFRWQEVKDPFLRQFARAAANASIPLLLGGQSLVNGGLMALVDILETRKGTA